MSDRFFIGSSIAIVAGGLLLAGFLLWSTVSDQHAFDANLKSYQGRSDDCVKREQSTANDEGERFDALLRCARLFPGTVPVQTVIEQESYWLHEMKRQLEGEHYGQSRNR